MAWALVIIAIAIWAATFWWLSQHPSLQFVGLSENPLIGGILVFLFLGLLLFFFFLVVPLGAGLYAARRKWPEVPVPAYFRGKRAVLPLALVCFGFMLAAAISGYWPPTSTRTGVLGAVFAALAATGSLAFVIALFGDKVMSSVFKLVPSEQQQAFAEELDALDSEARAATGQAADFTALDQKAVMDNIKERVIGQDHVVQTVVTTAFRRARLTRPNKPVGVVLFVGATGAGKTELAKALAAEMFESRLVRVDCNEMSEKATVARLIGSPPGYVGSEAGSDFCREIGRLGTGVILFDEIEKAHPDVLRVIMSLLDEARITEASTNRTYSARGFLIVMTSNAAAEPIAQIATSETDPELALVKVKDALRDTGFVPEVLARIDGVFPFAPLPARALAQIIEKFLLGFARDAGIELVSADSELLLDLVSRAHKTRNYGVREVVRAVENTVVDGLLDLKDAGHARAKIEVQAGRAVVLPA